MDLQLACKRALVTGASRGLGRAAALALAAEGAKVAVVARGAEELDGLLADLGGEDKGHIAVACDLTQAGAIADLHRRLEADFGGPDIVVHNLGGTLRIKNPLSPAEEYQRVWLLNVGVAIELNRFVVPPMAAKGWGRLVHVSSSSATMVDASLPYSSAKAALNTYVIGLGRELAKEGIIATAVMPGPFIAPGGHWDNVFRDKPEMVARFLQERMPLQRLGRAEEVAAVIAFLCSEHSSFMPGAIVPVHGGIR